jgi:hypothetical protein
MATLPQVLEIPVAGGPTAPSLPLPRRTEIASTGAGSFSKRTLREVALSTLKQGNCPPGCCECGRGQPAMRFPMDQTPLGREPLPQKPFQVPQSRQSVCEDALRRAGIDPDCLRELMQKGRQSGAGRPKTSTGRPKTSTGRPKTSGISGGKTAKGCPPNCVPKRKVRTLKRATARKPTTRAITRKGVYRKLSNGACLGPSGKFVKRSLCK